jgi:FMN phosphatase YigB (HAD superfamily)
LPDQGEKSIKILNTIMTKIDYLLFDLDGTLLHFNMNEFIEKYLSMIKNHFSDVREPQQIPDWILQGTELMLRNNGERINSEIFLEFFSARSGLPEALVWQRFLNFYQTDFGSLIGLTRAVTDARSVLEAAVARGYKLVLATQPVFPLVAIRQRLQWAELDDLPFELITHIENMHACKPSPSYFKEILNLLQIRPAQCLMIGNELETDMASQQIGIKAFYLADHKPSIQRKVDFTGNFRDLAAILGLENR